MFKGDYHFFEYKYNIIGYSGQDFGGVAQYVYLIISIILLTTLLIAFRKNQKEQVLKITKGVAIFLLIFYLVKTTWESYYDIKLGGSFNTGLLPLDACSIIILASILAGYGKGKIKEYANAWIATGSIVGGIATMVHLNAFKYYPFFSFGAFYSMIWHFLMVFIGLLYIVTKYVEIDYRTVIKGFIFHLIFSLFVIPIDFYYNFDFMMYKSLGGIPIFEGVAENLTNNGYQFLNPLMMLILYFIAFNIVFAIPLVINKLKKTPNLKKYLLVFMSIILITSCSEDKNPYKELADTWKYENSELISYVFKEDGTGIYKVGNNLIEFTYTIEGNKLLITYNKYNNPYEFEYSITDDLLTIEDGEEQQVIFERKHSK